MTEHGERRQKVIDAIALKGHLDVEHSKVSTTSPQRWFLFAVGFLRLSLFHQELAETHRKDVAHHVRRVCDIFVISWSFFALIFSSSICLLSLPFLNCVFFQVAAFFTTYWLATFLLNFFVPPLPDESCAGREAGMGWDCAQGLPCEARGEGNCLWSQSKDIFNV